MIKVATKEDKEICLEFLDKTIQSSMWKDFYPNINKEALVMSYLISPATRIALLVYNEETPIGLVAFDTYQYPDSPVKIGRISSLYLEEEFRGKGIMHTVLEAFHHWCKQIGCSYTNLGVTEGVDLEKHGYKKMEVLYLKDIR